MQEDSRYEPAIRLLDLAFEMHSKDNGMTIDEIQDYMESAHGKRPSERTTRRMIKALMSLDSQCIDRVDDFEKKARYGFVTPSMTRFVNFSAAEIATLQRILTSEGTNEQVKKDLTKILQNINTYNKRKKESIKDNIELLLQTEGYAVRPAPKCKVDTENVQKIREAIQNRRNIRCNYVNAQGEKKKRELSPLGFLYGLQKTYLIARIVGKGDDPCAFLVHKLSDIVIALQSFDSGDFDLKEYAQESFGIFHDKRLDVKLRFDAEVAEPVLQYEFHPTQKMEQEKDGSVVVTFSASGEHEILWHLFTWGDKCTILEPASLREHYVEMLKKVLDNYK